jgi:BirA family transcriptional regulator, biotin operon repressor / biotin---[acetyl-CoA-carboxylase] ligase
MIKWSIRAVQGYPQMSLDRISPKNPEEGFALLSNAKEDSGLLKFSTITTCGDETELLLALIATFSLSEGIRKDTGIISWLRWPNVVSIEGKTIASCRASKRSLTGKNVVQFDLQVNLSRGHGIGEVSLLDLLGVEVDDTLLLEKILDSLSWMHSGWTNGMHPQILKRIKSMTETIGSKISVQGKTRTKMGIATDIDDSGRLMIRLQDGRMVKLSLGTDLIHV